MMRWLLGVFGILLVLWCGWWVAGRMLILREAEAVIADQRAAGAEISYSEFGLKGFPSRFDLTARDLRYRDPSGRFGFEGPVVWLYAMSWKPWHIILGLPERQKVMISGLTYDLAGEGLRASLRSAPERDLPLKELRISGESLALAGPGLALAGAGPFSLGLRDAAGMTEDGGENLYQLGLTAGALQPDPALIAALEAGAGLPGAPAQPLPAEIDRLHLDLILGLSAPLDRHSGANKPAVESLDLRDLSLSWGALELSAKGRILPDDKGFASGRIDLSARNWAYLPGLLVASGKIDAGMVPLLQNMLRALALEGGDPDLITLPLILKDGRVNLGPLPLSAAPRLGTARP